MIDFDFIFVAGMILAAFAVPVGIVAYKGGRWPKMAVLMVLAGGGAMTYAARENPGQYSVATADDVFLSVVDDIVYEWGGITPPAAPARATATVAPADPVLNDTAAAEPADDLSQ